MKTIPAAERVVVTGLGLVTPLGADRESVWRRLLAGESAIAPVRSFDTSRHSARLGAEIASFEPRDYLARLDPATVGRSACFAVAAARLALADARITPAAVDAELAGVAMGTTSGEPQEVERLTDARVDGDLGRVGAEFLTRYPCCNLPETVAAELGFEGENVMLPTACAAGNYAIAYAFDALREGRATLMLAGGADCFSRITYTGFARLGAIAAERCQPFDRNRQGMVPGEGAAILVLETAEHAARRDARVYAEVAGYGLSCDAHHMTAAHPEGDGAARAMEAALVSAGLGPEDVDYVSAHGTGTPTNDRLESAALARVFGERLEATPVSSIKSMIGHTMGAASAIEAAVCALAIRDGRVPPTINFEEPDPDCPVDCVPNVARSLAVDVAMSNAYAFGGNNASLLLRRAS